MRFDDGDEDSDDPYQYEYARKLKRRRQRRMKTRAWRRAQRERVEAKAREIATYIHGRAKSWTEWWVVRHADNLKACSCWMCGNRRKTEGLTLQEQRVEYEWKELDDWIDESRRNKTYNLPGDEGWEYLGGRLRRKLP